MMRVAGPPTNCIIAPNREVLHKQKGSDFDQATSAASQLADAAKRADAASTVQAFAAMQRLEE